MEIRFTDQRLVSKLTRVGLFFSAFLILCNYYFFYFIDFEQGNVVGAGGFGLLKFAGLLAFYLMIFSPALKLRYGLEELVLGLFFSFSILLFFFKVRLFGKEDLLFLNLVICALPFLFFRLRSVERVRVFLSSCLLILVFQVFLDLYIYLAGYSLWNNKAFIGGVGNPSSFGFVSNIFVAYVLFFRERGWGSFLAFCVLSFGIVMTNSMFSLLLLVLIFIAWGMARGGRNFVLCGVSVAAVAVGLGFFGSDHFISQHLTYKLESLIDLVTGRAETGSTSVSLRVEIHRFFWERLSADFFDVLFYGYPGRHYYSADSQYLSYIGSFGLLGSLLFFGAIFFGFLSAVFRRDSFSRFSAVVMMMFIFMFFSNRALDYYPIPLFLFLIIASSRLFGGVAPTKNILNKEGCSI